MGTRFWAAASTGAEGVKNFFLPQLYGDTSKPTVGDACQQFESLTCSFMKLGVVIYCSSCLGPFEVTFVHTVGNLIPWLLSLTSLSSIKLTLPSSFSVCWGIVHSTGIWSTIGIWWVPVVCSHGYASAAWCSTAAQWATFSFNSDKLSRQRPSKPV